MDGLFGSVLLVVALALDAFVAALGYGAAAIRIPFRSLLVLAAICSGALGVSIWAGGLLTPLLPVSVARGIGCGILALLGLLKLAEEPLKRRRAPKPCPKPEPGLSPGALLSIYCSPNCADRDGSRTLSPAEAAALALALSLDGMAAGLGAGAVELRLLSVLFCSMLVHLLGIRLGEWLGKRIAQAVPLPLAPVCGVLLLLLAALQFRG